MVRFWRNRQRLHPLPAFAVVLVLATGWLSEPAGASPSSSSSGLHIGLSYGDLVALSDTAFARALDDAVALGVSWLRVDLAWSEVQPESSTVFDWARYDRIVIGAGARNLRVLPILTYTPAWARPPGCTSNKCAPEDAARFAAFAEA